MNFIHLQTNIERRTDAEKKRCNLFMIMRFVCKFNPPLSWKRNSCRKNIFLSPVNCMYIILPADSNSDWGLLLTWMNECVREHDCWQDTSPLQPPPRTSQHGGWPMHAHADWARGVCSQAPVQMAPPASISPSRWHRWAGCGDAVPERAWQ